MAAGHFLTRGNLQNLQFQFVIRHVAPFNSK